MPHASDNSGLPDNYIHTLKSNTDKMIHTAFVLLLSNFESLTTGSSWISVYEKPAELTEIESSIVSIITGLEDILALEPYSRQSFKERLCLYKDTVAEMERSIQTYVLNTQFLKRILSDLPLVIGFTDIDEDYVVKTCVAYAESGCEPPSMAARMSRIISCLPVAMRRDALESYLLNGYLMSLPDDTAVVIENILQLHKIEFKPDSAPEHGKYFAEMKYDVEKIQREILADIQLSRMDYFHTALDNFYSEVNIIRDRLFVSFESINFLLILMDFSDTMDSLLLGNFICKDIFYAIRDSGKNSDTEFLSERLSELLADEAEKAIDALKDAGCAPDKVLSGVTADRLRDLSGDTAEAYDAWHLVSTRLYENLIDSAFILRGTNRGRHGEPASGEFKRDRVEALVAYILAVLEDEPGDQTELRKKHLVHNLPCAFTIDEFKTFVSDSLKTCSDKQQKADIAYKIINVLIDADFLDPESTAKNTLSNFL